MATLSALTPSVTPNASAAPIGRNGPTAGTPSSAFDDELSRAQSADKDQTEESPAGNRAAAAAGTSAETSARSGRADRADRADSRAQVRRDGSDGEGESGSEENGRIANVQTPESASPAKSAARLSAMRAAMLRAAEQARAAVDAASAREPEPAMADTDPDTRTASAVEESHGESSAPSSLAPDIALGLAAHLRAMAPAEPAPDAQVAGQAAPAAVANAGEPTTAPAPDASAGAVSITTLAEPGMGIGVPAGSPQRPALALARSAAQPAIAGAAPAASTVDEAGDTARTAEATEPAMARSTLAALDLAGAFSRMAPTEAGGAGVGSVGAAAGQVTAHSPQQASLDPLQAATDASLAAASDPGIDPPIGSPAFAPALGARIAWLAREGVDNARLNVHPAELGPVAVQLALDGAQLRVEMVAEAASTRQALESSLPALASALRDAGFTLAGGGVFQQAQQQRRDTPEADANSRITGVGRRRGSEAGDALLGPEPAVRRNSATRGLVDLFA